MFGARYYFPLGLGASCNKARLRELVFFSRGAHSGMGIIYTHRYFSCWLLINTKPQGECAYMNPVTIFPFVLLP